MMHGRKQSNITALLESIEGLHALATDSENPKETPSLVKNNEVVKLKTVFSSRTSGDASDMSFATVPEAKRSPALHDETDFDAKLARLIQDVVGNEPQAATPPQTTKKSVSSMRADSRKTPYLEPSSSDDARDIRAEIDNLLAPYLDKTKSRPAQNSAPNPNQRQAKSSAQKQSQRLDQEPTHKPLQKETIQTSNSQPAENFINTASGNKNIRAFLSPEDLQELNLFIKEEIKKQISVWIAQNIDQIIEDSLLSDRPDARNASGVTREMTKNSG